MKKPKSFKPALYIICIMLLFNGCKKEDDSQDLANDYIAYFPFNGNAKDESSNKNHGIVNGATLTSDRKNQANSAYFFDGSSDISIPNADFFDQMDKFCISAWVNPSEVPIQHNTIICKVQPSRHFLIKILKDNMKLEAHFAIDADYYKCFSKDKIELNKWVHIIYQWTGTKWQFYKNGNFVTEEDYSGFIPPTGGNVMNIGSMGGSFNFTGKIDDIRIYDRILTEEEIEFVFKN